MQLGSRSVASFALRNRAPLKGVISRVVLSVEQLKLMIPGETEESLSVLLSVYPTKSCQDTSVILFIGFVPKPLPFFRCNVDGHVAAVCRRVIPRCGKCAGGHGIENCVVSVLCVGVHCCWGSEVSSEREAGLGG